MKLTLKAFVGLLAALLLAVLGGWIWGSGDRSRADESLARAGVDLHLAGARGRMLQARVDLFEVNFGNASRSLEAARADLKTWASALDRLRREDDAEAARKAIALVEEAQQMAGRLDQTANAKLAEALALLPKAP